MSTDAIEHDMTRKLVDPLHFFDARGHSVLTGDVLAAENKRLKAEVERLRQIILRLSQRQRERDAASTPPTLN